MKSYPIVSIATTLLFSLHAVAGEDSTVADGTDLGGGVITRTDVKKFADLSLDVRDIEQSISGGNTNEALSIYRGGKHSERRLTELSTKLANEPVANATPLFLFQLHGLGGRSIDLEELSGNAAYADSYVRSAIQNGRSTASTAALVLNTWMYAGDTLYKGTSTCQKKTEADNPSQFKSTSHGFDEFIALWIGSGQTHGSSEGSSLYALAERADRFFTPVLEDGEANTYDNDNDSETRALAESPVNKNLKLWYQEGASILSIPGVCTKFNPDSSKQLWSVVNRINTQMYIPLMQMLIVSILEKDVLATELYATAIVPQLAQCRPSVYDRLNEELLEGQPNFQRTNILLKDLQDIYSCFGITCDEIGTVAKKYKDFGMPECVAPRGDAPMALYKPSTNIQPVARIDLDVLQIRILTSMGSFDFAKLFYLYGRNSPRQRDSENDPYSFYSLSELAISTSRQNAEPYYSAFISYHNHPTYADVLIQNTLEGVGKWDSTKSVEQRSAVITEASSFLVLYLHLIAQINDAVNSCRNTDQDGEYELTHPWDEVAALTIGSLEGMKEGGSSNILDGQMIWGLGSQRGYQFQTENSRGYAKVNSELEDLLYAGRGEIDALNCDMLEETAENIKIITIIPLLQSVLKYAILNDELPANSPSANLALGEIFALAIIPILQMYDPPSAQILEENMITHSGIKPVRGGAQQVANAIGSAALAMGISPRDLGSTSEADPSRLYGGSPSPSIQPRLLSALATVGTIVFLLF
uniref:Uncharacterized protein n=1 Tax=Pseudo-nitzschia australis TaxID=44445 RepID=A0A7S4ANZ9_9STRA|mmetsp:Transcript_21264/g.44786  ORF Transcript_21264/g.44786 Transcript_21264/m.44786 type:complete len:757 (+) Transcript_21264:90-2360(+)